MEEEHVQPETTLESDVVIPTHTKEMDEVKAAEEQIWKEENLMTERDLEIASKDIPERMQLGKGSVASSGRLQRYASSTTTRTAWTAATGSSTSCSVRCSWT